jgi:hypothetical protein
VSWRRKGAIRVYLKDWCSPDWTGEGERLAVILGPSVDSQKKPLDLIDFEKAVGSFAPFVTRWGADPIRLSGGPPGGDPVSHRLEELIPHNAFSGYDNEGLVENLQLPYAFEPQVDPLRIERIEADAKVQIHGQHFLRGATVCINGETCPVKEYVDDTTLVVTCSRSMSAPFVVEVRNPSLTVSALAYTPKCDEEDGLWYCDIQIDTRDSYFPFVQLGLARYQPHCVNGLELSPPTTAWAQLVPRREGDVTISRKTKSLVVQHHGVGFRRSDAGPQHAHHRHLTDTPLLNVRLLRAVRPHRLPDVHDSTGWVPAMGPSRMPIETLRRAPETRANYEAWWICSLPLPPCLPDIRYGLLIEEIEMMASDASDPAKVLASSQSIAAAGATELVERGPTFSRIIDLGDYSW